MALPEILEKPRSDFWDNTNMVPESLETKS
jgi:hypothetical protein